MLFIFSICLFILATNGFLPGGGGITTTHDAQRK
jgi:hypothetical protein